MSAPATHEGALVVALTRCTRELTDVLEMGEDLAGAVVNALALGEDLSSSGRERLLAHANRLRTWHVGARHTGGIAERARVLAELRADTATD